MLKTLMVSQWKYILVSNAKASRFFLQGQYGITLDNTKYKIKHENLVVSPLKANATTKTKTQSWWREAGCRTRLSKKIRKHMQDPLPFALVFYSESYKMSLFWKRKGKIILFLFFSSCEFDTSVFWVVERKT
jgi:hypothetical protein